MKKLKVLLTNAPGLDLKRFDREHNKIRGYGLSPPIQLTTIAGSVLKKVKDVEVDILDLELDIRKFFIENKESPLSPRELMKKKIVDKMDEFQPDLVGMTVVFSPSHNNTLDIADIVKEKNPSTQVVCGGIHATFAYQRILEKCLNMDFIFLYEGDNTFPLFLEYLQGKTKFEALKGIAWFDKTLNEVKLSSYAPLVHDLDEIPRPSWDLVPLKEYQKYGFIAAVQRFGNENLPTYSMQTVRGCVAACTFCSVRGFYGKGVRSYSAKRVLQDIDYLYNELGIKQLEIVDDDFTHDRERALEICNELTKRNYDLVWNLRNGIRLGTINEEVMHALVTSKCRYIAIGVESGNDRTLAIIKKPLSEKMLYRKSEIFNRYPEVYVAANFIIGFPFESDEELMNTFKVAEDLGFDWNTFNPFRPLVGTPEFQKLDKESQNKVIDNQDSDYMMIFEATRKQKSEEEAIGYKNEIERQMEEALQHPEEGGNFEEPAKGYEHNVIDILIYTKNLEINFLKNKNLTGKFFDKYLENDKGKYRVICNKKQNLDRTIRDFKGVLTFIKKDHAIAHYCLAKAYSYKGKGKLVKQHMNKVSEILTQNKSWIKYFDQLVPKDEMNYLKNF